MEWITEPQAWIALATLTALEIVLGIDNIIFISVLTGRLPRDRQRGARRVGLLLAMVMRILLLMSLSWIMRLDTGLFSVPFAAVLGLEGEAAEVSGRDLILVAGGLFLIAKATIEIHHKLEGDAPGAGDAPKATVTYGSVMLQVALLDLVFSLDSVITAVGMVEHIAVMVIAVVVSIIVMVLFVNAICAFVESNPTFKMLALSFLVLIGFTLVAEGLALHISKGYVYFAIAFSIAVEVLNLRVRRHRPMRRLGGPRLEDRNAPVL